MKLGINTEIALTHISKRKKQTFIASMGVTIGLALYIFSNSLITGFGNYSRSQIFKSVPHLRIYQPDNISEPISPRQDSSTVSLISNPKITNTSRQIIDPYALLSRVRALPYVTSATPQVNADIFFINGQSRLRGVGNGVIIREADAMFSIDESMIAGSLDGLSTDLNAIVIGKGIAEKLSLGIDDNITIVSSGGTRKVMKIRGIFSTGNKSTDESKAYMNLTAAQQMEGHGPGFITEIFVGTVNADSSETFAQDMQQYTAYKVEDWKTSNADALNEERVQKSMNSIVAIAILMIAGFGIYNILNMTISQKLNDIAILKATGFAGKDIVRIFVTEAFIMGIGGTLLGLLSGLLLIRILSGVYVGDPIGYFPTSHDPAIFIKAALFGMTVSLGAGYFPARKASKVDPVSIFRK